MTVRPCTITFRTHCVRPNLLSCRFVETLYDRFHRANMDVLNLNLTVKVQLLAQEIVLDSVIKFFKVTLLVM
jgi:hypothetical protein